MSFEQAGKFISRPARHLPGDQEAIRGRRSSRTRQHLPVRRGRWRLILFSPHSIRLSQTRSRIRCVLVASPSRDLSSPSLSFCMYFFSVNDVPRDNGTARQARVGIATMAGGKTGARRLKGGCARAARNYERDTNSYCRRPISATLYRSLSLRKEKKLK